MKDPEFIALRNKFLMGLGFVIIVTIPLLFLLINKFGDTRSSVLKSFYAKDTFVIYLNNSKECNFCKVVMNKLDSDQVNYFSYDISKEKDYKEVLYKLEISENALDIPGVVFVVEGKVYSNLLGIDDINLLDSFLETYHLKYTK